MGTSSKSKFWPMMTADGHENTYREESFAFAFFAQIHKSFFRKKSIIHQPQKFFFTQNLRKK